MLDAGTKKLYYWNKVINSLLKHNQHIAQKRVYSVHSTGFFTE